MTKGDLGLEPTLIGVVTNIATAGVSDLELFFREPNQKRLPIMTPYDTRQAFGCKACRLIVFWTDDKEEPTDTECLVCRTTIPADASSCPKCGWTYEEGAG